MSNLLWYGITPYLVWLPHTQSEEISVMPEIVKVTTNLPKDAVDALREDAALKGDNLTQGLKAAISTKLYLDEEVRKGAKIFVQEPDGQMVQLRLP
jgi:hypothetical protein